MKIKVKKLSEKAVLPAYAHNTDAGLDLVAISKTLDEYGNFVYGTGLAFEIPRGYVGLIFPRSSISNYDLTLTNSVGVIDSGYRGEVTFKFKPYHNLRSRHGHYDYAIGERIGQLIIIPYPDILLEEVDTLSPSERGTGGYGSTGK